jgi:hypothetical protein
MHKEFVNIYLLLIALLYQPEDSQPLTEMSKGKATPLEAWQALRVPGV